MTDYRRYNASRLFGLLITATLRPARCCPGLSIPTLIPKATAVTEIIDYIVDAIILFMYYRLYRTQLI